MKSQYIKYCLLFLGIFLCTLTCQAQDLIIFNNAEEIPAKVEQVNIDEIVYKKYNNLEGPSYIIPKSMIFMIKYQNGIKEIYTDHTEPVIKAQPHTAPAKLTFANHKFRLDHKAIIDYDEVDQMMQKSKNPEAYKTFKIAKTQQTLSRPARVFGLIAGIAGTIIAFELATTYTDSNSSPNNSTNENASITLAATSTIGIAGWVGYAYSIVLKRKASYGFKKSTDMYNAAF
jgi:hypothetical protein